MKIQNKKKAYVIIENINISDTASKKTDEHASVHNSGQPPSRLKKITLTKKTFLQIVIVFVLTAIILSLILACSLVNANGFNNIVKLIKEIVDYLLS